MIISHSRRFISLKARKTGGSTVCALLNPHLGPADIQVGDWPDTLEAGGRYNRQAYLAAARRPLKLLKGAYTYTREHRTFGVDPRVMNKLTKRHVRPRLGKVRDHAFAHEVRSFEPTGWETYFRFAFTRNPWSHAVSDYYWRLRVRNRPDVSFPEFLKRLEDPDRPDPERLRPPIITNWQIYTIDDEIAVDFVGRFECFDEDLGAIFQRIGVPLVLSGYAAKSGIRTRDKTIEDHYDAETAELVRRIYRKDIEAFGYEPFDTRPQNGLAGVFLT